MTTAARLTRAIETAESNADYWQDIAVTDFTNDLHRRMQRLRISQGELARRMGTSRPYVTKLLAGGNFTLHTMVRLAMALDSVVRLRLEGLAERAAGRRSGSRATASDAMIVDFADRERKLKDPPRLSRKRSGKQAK
jgi:transcriptional regulator with XRE-family HTH domain